MDSLRLVLVSLVIAGCGGGGSSVVPGDDDDDTTDPAPVGDDDDDDDDAVPPEGELVRVEYPEAIDFTWQTGASECPFVVGTFSITNDHESVDAMFELTADKVGGQQAVMFRPEGGASLIPAVGVRVHPGETLSFEVLYACMITQTFDTEVQVMWELPTLEGPFYAYVPVHGEIGAR